MMRFSCWLFGCKEHPMDPAPIEHLTCQRCGELMTYEGFAGISRWSDFKSNLYWHGFRKWFPERCSSCGKRYGDHYDCLPF